MKKTLLISGLAMGIMLGALAQQADPVAVLKSDAPYKDKADACRELVIVGGRDAVPVLAPMLLDEKTSHIARNALEPMPFPEAGAALRDALGKTEGRLRIGMISSLAIRKDAEAVPALAQILGAEDDAVSQAAARALGVIANDLAVQALRRAGTQAGISDGTVRAIADALFDVAEGYLKADKRRDAAAIYQRIFEYQGAPVEVKVAALRGVVLARGADGGARMLARFVQHPEEPVFEGALRVARELDDKAAVAAMLASTLPELDAARKVRVMHLMGQLGSDGAARALMKEAKAGPEEVRIGALAALTSLASKAAIPLLERYSWQEEGAVAEAARNDLAYFPGEAGDAALRAMLKDENPKARAAAVAMIGDGGLPEPVAPLMRLASRDADEGVRVAALKAMHAFAGEAELDGVLKCLLAAKSDAEVRAAESILQSVCGTMKRGGGDIVVKKAIYGDLEGGKTADVTKQVRKMVAGGATSVEASNGNFKDPAPGTPKQLRIDYESNGAAHSGVVREKQHLQFGAAAIPEAVTAKFLRALPGASGETANALVRILPTAGGQQALDTVIRLARASGDTKDAALRALCGWPTPDALPVLTQLASQGEDQRTKSLALRGAVSLIQLAGDDAERVTQYASLLDGAGTAADAQVVLGALAGVPTARAFAIALTHAKDGVAGTDALQAAAAIAEKLGENAKTDETFFNGKDLNGWNGQMEYWSVKNGVVIGGGDMSVPQNEFLWSKVPVTDFYLAIDVKLNPPTGNAGIQFRSKKVDDHGQALGYQADAGEGWWGKLYHEHGRKLLDDNNNAADVVKSGDWNRYEILAVGPAIWTAVNGKLCTALLDPEGESEGQLALQLHAGAPQTVQYRIRKLVHNPEVTIAGIEAKPLVEALAD